MRRGCGNHCLVNNDVPAGGSISGNIGGVREARSKSDRMALVCHAQRAPFGSIALCECRRPAGSTAPSLRRDRFARRLTKGAETFVRACECVNARTAKT
jgi:hypothetical protein